MPAKKRSDLGDSLHKVLSSKTNKKSMTSEESVKPASKENVTSIDIASDQIKQKKSEEIDPFTEANGSDDIVGVDKRVEPELDSADVEIYPDEILPIEDKQTHHVSEPKIEKVSSKKTIKSERKNSSGSLPGVAIVLSILALLSSGYSIFSQDSIKQGIAEATASLESSIADISDRTDLFQFNLASIKQSVFDNSSDISRIEGIESEVLQLQESINSIRSAADQVNDLIQSHKSQLGEHNQQIENLQSDVKRLSVKPKPVIKKVSAKSKTKSKPVVINSNSVEGATLSAIDQWGTSSYVVLRDSSGDWIPLQRGDKYKGWRYTGTTGDHALFKKGSKTKKLATES